METNRITLSDALYDVNTISCASFLYFDKGQIGISLHPTVSMFLSGCEPLDFCKFVDEKNPSWKASYFALYKLWVDSESRIHHTGNLLKNMQEQKFFSS